MNISAFYDSPLSDDERRERLYKGDIFIFSPSPATKAIIELAAGMLERAFAPFHPGECSPCRRRTCSRV